MNQQFLGLPNSDRLDIATFSRLFDKKATSYKFLFFLALLNLLGRKFFKENIVDLESLMVEMLTIAWYPHSVFKLSFGVKDQVAEHLDSLNLDIQKSLLEVTEGDMKYLRQKILMNSSDVDSIKELMRFVPYRLVRPFFSKEIKGMLD